MPKVENKTYSIKELAVIAHISVRALHHYDAIGLLNPSRQDRNNYRRYDEADLLRLQQILFFRELDFPLGDIKKILDASDFDLLEALKSHRKLVSIKQKRLQELVGTIDKTIKKIKKETTMNDNDLYDGFSDEESKQYAAEAKERWGHTDAYKQSQERVKKMTKADMDRIKEEGAKLTREIADCYESNEPVDSAKMQALIARHYDGLRAFYEPNPEMYRGLGEMYVADERFTAFYDKFSKGLATYLRDGMIAFANAIENANAAK